MPPSTTKKTYRWGPILASLMLALVIIVLSYKTRADAQMKGALPFGGKVVYVDYCCDGSVYMVVVGQKGGTFIFSPYSSMIYMYYNVWTAGPWVVGDANPGGYCELIDTECEGGISGNMITRIGTSPN